MYLGYDTMFANLFRRSNDVTNAYVRPAGSDDLTGVARLLRDAGRRYYGLQGNELAQLLAAAPAAIYETPPNDILGVALSGWRTRRVTWLRCLALARGLDSDYAVPQLLSELHATLRDRDILHIFFAGDDTADTWLSPVLRRCGYVQDTRVVVYEKHSLSIPSWGNTQIRIRPARASDLTQLIELDNLCFEAHWTKSQSAFGTALREDALFVVAELHERLVGYAYATSHFGGRLLHLVRIAVRPGDQQGGIGARLMAELVAYAREKRSDVITLNTQEYNERAQRLYRWFGFAPNGESQTILRYDL